MKPSTRIRLAKYPIILALASSTIAGLMTVGFVIACLGGCSREIKSWQIITLCMLAITVVSILIATFNFLARFYIHKWGGLIVWEKAMLYLVIFVVFSPILLEIYFYIEVKF